MDHLANALILEFPMGTEVFRRSVPLLQPYTIHEVWELLKAHFGLPTMLTLSGGVARACYI